MSVPSITLFLSATHCLSPLRLHLLSRFILLLFFLFSLFFLILLFLSVILFSYIHYFTLYLLSSSSPHLSHLPSLPLPPLPFRFPLTSSSSLLLLSPSSLSDPSAPCSTSEGAAASLLNLVEQAALTQQVKSIYHRLKESCYHSSSPLPNYRRNGQKRVCRPDLLHRLS